MKHILEIANMGGRYGIETFIMNVLRELDHSEFKVDFISLEAGPFDEEIESYGGTIFRVTPMRKFRRRYLDTLNLLRNHSDIQTVHIHANTAIGCLDAIAAYKAKVPQIIIHSHNDGVADLRGRILHYLARRLIKNKTTTRFACSKQAGIWMFGDSADFKVVPNGVDLVKFSYDTKTALMIREKYGLCNKFVIGHVGRMEIQKNHRFILKVFDKIAKEKDNAILLLIGDGSQAAILEKLWKELGLENKIVWIHEANNVNELLMSMDVFLFPSIWEGLGISLVEAQASGLRCIVSDAIKNEVCVTKSIKKMSLQDNIDRWKDAILAEVEHPRGHQSADNIERLKEAGYDRKETAELISSYYRYS